MKLDTTTEEYAEYKRTQLHEHNRYRLSDDRNTSAEGHRFDPSNVILMDMAKFIANTGTVALDVGCCEGFHTEQLKEICGTAYGIDINEESLSYAARHGRDYCQYGDMHKIEFPDETFDLVFSHEVLEHALDFNLAISEIYRVLKPDGHLVFSVPCECYEGWYKEYMSPPGDSHFSVMTPFNVREAVKKCGFTPLYGDIYNLSMYSKKLPWTEEKIQYGFFPHLHAVLKKG